MHRKKRSFFPITLLLCLLCLLLLGFRQGLFSADSSFSLPNILHSLFSEKTQDSALPETSCSAVESVISEAAFSVSERDLSG